MKLTKRNFIFWKNTKAGLRKDLLDNDFDKEVCKRYLVADKAEGKAYKKYLDSKNRV